MAEKKTSRRKMLVAGAAAAAAAVPAAEAQSATQHKVHWSGDKKPMPEDIHRIHERAHDECYIANSLKGEVTVADVPPVFA